MDFKNIVLLGEETNCNLYNAVREGNLGKVRDLIGSFDLSYPQAWSQGYSLVCDAVQHNHSEITKLLLANGAKVISEDRNPCNTPLHFAVINGDIEIVEMLLSRNAIVHAKNNIGRTPLHNAVEYEERNIIEVLLYWGADVNATDNDGKTPLHIASQLGHLEIVDCLLRHGTSVDVVCSPINSIESYTALHFAVTERHERVVRLLLEYGANVDTINRDDKTLLHFAVEKRYTSIVDHILEHCPDINNKSNRRSLECAVCGYGEECRKISKSLLQYGFTVDSEDVNNCEFLHAAIQKGYFNIVQRLLIYGADINMLSEKGYDSALHTATKNGEEEIVKLIINFGGDVNVIDVFGNPPILYAVKNTDISLFKILLHNGAKVKCNPDLLNEAVVHNCIEIAEILLQYGADVNAHDRYGITPLHSLFDGFRLCLNYFPDTSGFAYIIRLLLSSGADVTAIDDEDMTTLHCAAEEDYEHLVEVLLEFNADVNATTGTNATPLHFAAATGNEKTIEMLLNKEANVNAALTDGTTALHIAARDGYLEVVDLLLKSGADTSSRSKHEDSRTALHLASAGSYADIVLTLLKYGADVHDADDYGMTALHLASKTQQVRIVDSLLNYGSNIEAKDKYGGTALHYASKHYCTRVVDFLLNSGSNIDAKGKLGRTALHMASEKDYVGIVKQLLEYGADTNCMDDYGRTALDLAYIMGRRNAVVALSDVFVKVDFYLFTNGNSSSSKQIGYSDYLRIECEKEITMMKNHKISIQNVTVYDFLTDIQQLVKYVRNEGILQTFKSYDFERDYPIYSGSLRCNFEQAVKRKNLLERICNVFHSLFKCIPALPRNCSEEILNYLSNRDLRILIRVCQPTY